MKTLVDKTLFLEKVESHGAYYNILQIYGESYFKDLIYSPATERYTKMREDRLDLLISDMRSNKIDVKLKEFGTTEVHILLCDIYAPLSLVAFRYYISNIIVNSDQFIEETKFIVHTNEELVKDLDNKYKIFIGNFETNTQDPFILIREDKSVSSFGFDKYGVVKYNDLN